MIRRAGVEKQIRTAGQGQVGQKLPVGKARLSAHILDLVLASRRGSETPTGIEPSLQATRLSGSVKALSGVRGGEVKE